MLKLKIFPSQFLIIMSVFVYFLLKFLLYGTKRVVVTEYKSSAMQFHHKVDELTWTLRMKNGVSIQRVSGNSILKIPHTIRMFFRVSVGLGD